MLQVNFSILSLGYTAGKQEDQIGSGGDMQCLPTDPQWDGYEDGNYHGYRAHIFGAEIDLPSATHYFTSDVYQQDMPCAVCRTSKATTLMIPARTSCYITKNILDT